MLGGAFKNMMVVNLALDPHLEHGAYYIDQCLVERLKIRRLINLASGPRFEHGVIDAYMILACIPTGGGEVGG